MPLQAGSGQALSAAFDVGFGWRSAFSAAIKVTGHEGFSARGLLFSEVPDEEAFSVRARSATRGFVLEFLTTLFDRAPLYSRRTF